MPRKVVNRKELREEAEAAEKLESSGTTKAKKKKTAKRKTRVKETPQLRMKLYWGVFSQSMKRVALYDFTQKKEAEKKAKELSASGKSPHFVQKVKEAIEE